jgi:hypothetical protein
LFLQLFFDVYCGLVQALLPVQLFCVVSPGFEQAPALAQLFWSLLPEIEQLPTACPPGLEISLEQRREFGEKSRCIVRKRLVIG